MGSGEGSMAAAEGASRFERGMSARTAVSRLRRSGIVLLTAGILVAAAVVAVLAPWIAPADPDKVDIANRLRPPGWSPAGGPVRR